jgi:hypothetical protein
MVERDSLNRPLTLVQNETFMKKFYTTEGSREAKELEKLKKDYGFGYRNGIGELIYAMVTCRPDQSPTAVRCTQYSNKPARIHSHAVRRAIKDLYMTREESIYFWRPEPNNTLPEHEQCCHHQW